MGGHAEGGAGVTVPWCQLLPPVCQGDPSGDSKGWVGAPGSQPANPVPKSTWAKQDLEARAGLEPDCLGLNPGSMLSGVTQASYLLWF